MALAGGFFITPYNLRNAINYLCTRDKKKSKSEGYFKFTDHSIELYHRDPKTIQSNILYVHCDELLRFTFNPGAQSVPVDNSLDLELSLDLSADSKVIDDLTNLDFQDKTTINDREIVFPLNLDSLNKYTDVIKKKSGSMHLAIYPSNPNSLKIAFGLDPDANIQNQSFSIDKCSNDVERLDFSVYEQDEEDQPFCIESMDKITSDLSKFDKLNIKNLVINIYPNGVILVPQTSTAGDFMWGKPDTNIPVIGKVSLVVEQIKALKSLGPCAPSSPVKMYVKIQKGVESHFRFVFHIGYYAYLHSIFPLDK